MQMDFYPAEERGRTEIAWLDSYHSFSFGEYYDPKKMQFGALRVINDDVIAPGKGFPLHAHDNMEIVTIVLSGALEHKDSMGNKGVIKSYEVQRMSAGTGIKHSEYNASKEEKVHLLQIWVLPQERNIEPSYEQKSFSKEKLKNRLVPIVQNAKDSESVYIHQQAAFFLGDIDAGKEVSHEIPENKGVYAFVIKGEGDFMGKTLKTGDAAGIWYAAKITFRAKTSTELLLIEVAKAP